MIDGVNKFFLVYNENRTMHFDGQKTLIEIAEAALRKLTCLQTPHERKMVMQTLNERLEACFASWDDPGPKVRTCGECEAPISVCECN
jgi:hypothetical protein